MKDGGTLAPKDVAFLKLNFSVTKRKFFSTKKARAGVFCPFIAKLIVFPLFPLARSTSLSCVVVVVVVVVERECAF